MPSESANSSPGVNYWYGNSLPDGLPQDGNNPRMLRRASEAVIHSHAFHSQEPSPWDHGGGPLHLDTSQVANLVIRPQSSSSNANHKAPLAPKQGLAGSLANSRAQHQSPISGTYALRTPRGKITSIACESCRKRKSKCDGVRPKCNTCQSKNLSCVYDVAEDGKTTTQLRAHVRRLAKELDDMKSIVSLLAMAPDRATAANWASELEKNGFAHHSAEEIKKSLQEIQDHQQQLPDGESLGTPGSEPFARPPQSLATSSYDGSSRDDSREQSQPALGFQTESAIDGVTAYNYSETNELAKFSFDCAFYRRTKREMLANGWDEAQIFGRNDFDVDTVLLGFMDPQDNQPVPTWAARTVNKILPTAPVPVRLASTYLLTKMMRWLIWPSVENMNAMPDWLMPLAGKDSAPYDILVDLLPWPQLRQYLYQHPGEFVSGTFVGFVSLNWPYADDACHYWDIESACTRMTPLFENHVGDLNSWILDAKAIELMPQLEGLVPVKVG
ncbi:hypothetical protein BS50DRAFT_600454 [Corynespora cassiicola Philippines]|uniref:Zn(2)-C6 fungal-type domain-containing protein n=1 Tax=Corynespora cassiicola Philippines TaxID=1448308 RepID=A0A2T2NN17_CORCC|nr:hypothetical protein BS50DRAFT_600454 [Corynespora cassiicola Philippines]